METRRDQHQDEVQAYLRQHVRKTGWQLGLPPHGSGHETYFAEGEGLSCFVKLGARTEIYEAMAALGLSPAVIATGRLEDGTPILVQLRVQGRKPSRSDFQANWRQFAESLRKVHTSAALQALLPGRPSARYQEAGMETLEAVTGRWRKYAGRVPASTAEYVEGKICALREDVRRLEGEGLAAAHHDVCNGNWLVAADGSLYLLDYEAMALDDPAVDLGAILWWYYPPEMRGAFLETAGYEDEPGLRERMRVRMAIHNLHILLPRENSFDVFGAESFDAALVDFRAVVDGKENPQGYVDG